MHAKTILCGLLLFFVLSNGTAQISNPVSDTIERVPIPAPPPPDAKKIDLLNSKDTSGVSFCPNPDELPEFIGGRKAMFEYIKNNLKYQILEGGMEGTVYVLFIIETDGRLTNVEVKRGISGFCNEIAKKFVETMVDKWQAGKKNGEPVRSLFTLPLRFRYE